MAVSVVKEGAGRGGVGEGQGGVGGGGGGLLGEAKKDPAIGAG